MLNGTMTAAVYSNGKSFNNLIINDGLVGYWKLDAATASGVMDHSGYGGQGTITGAPVTSTDTRGLNFANSGSIDFDGAGGQYVRITHASQFNFTNKITVAAWVKLDTTETFARWVTKGSDPLTFPFLLGQSTTAAGVPRFRVITSVGVTSEGTAALKTGVWYHLAGTYDGSNVRLYVDGIQIDSDAQTGNLATNTTDGVTIACDSDCTGADAPDGKIDDVRIYNRALSAAEVL